MAWVRATAFGRAVVPDVCKDEGGVVVQLAWMASIEHYAGLASGQATRFGLERRMQLENPDAARGAATSRAGECAPANTMRSLACRSSR